MQADRPAALDHRLAALVLLVGFQFRSVIVGVPPVLPELRADTHLNFSATGALTATSVLGLGLAAIPGALLVNRFGARRVVTGALTCAGLGALLRVGPPSPYSIFLWTAVLALSIAVAQPGISVVVRAWFPHAIQQASTLYALALGLGGLAGASLSVYLLAFGGWRGTFVIWGVIALAGAVVWALLAPGRGDPHQAEPSGFRRLVRDPAVWHVALLFGSQSMVYYGAATWLPFLLRDYGHGYRALVLFLLQVVSPPISLFLIYLHRDWARSRRFYALGGCLVLVGSTALGLGASATAWLWAPLMGAGIAMIFSGAMALPALFARQQSDVAGYSALVLTAGYIFSFLGPLLGGVVLDHTRILASPFWVLSVSGLIALGLGARLPKQPQRPAPFSPGPGVPPA